MGAIKESRVERFIGHVSLDMAERGWTLRLDAGERVYTDPKSKGADSACIGWTDETLQLIHVAMNADRWLYGLVHEYAHFRLFVERPEHVKAGIAGRYDEAVDTMERWVKHPTSRLVASDDAWAAAKVIAKEEAAAELRALKVIDEHRLPMCKTTQNQHANAYILSLAFTAAHRMWIPRDVYDSIEFRKQFPGGPMAMKFARALKTKYRQFAPTFEAAMEIE